MGQCRSAVSYTFVPNETISGQGGDAVEVFRRLKLSDREISIFYQAFREIDVLNSGYIRADEFFNQRSLACDDFNMAMFQLFDDQLIKVLDFMEFVCSVSRAAHQHFVLLYFSFIASYIGLELSHPRLSQDPIICNPQRPERRCRNIV